MFLKFLWNAIKQLRWILPIAITLFVGYNVYLRYQTLQQSPLGNFLPKDPVTIDLTKIFNTTQQAEISPTPTTIPESVKVTIKTDSGPIIITAETAATPEKRDLGLMYRPSLPAYRGMLFIFEYPVQYGFWMKNCEIPLDMIFIDEKDTIVDIKENVPPCKTIDPTQNDCPSYVPKAKYVKALEVAGGTVKANKIKNGDKSSESP